MSLPGDLTTIIVTATYESINGVPLSGQVGFSVAAPVMDSTGKVILGIQTQYATLNSAGYMSITLPCTDNVNLNPTGFTYLVTEQVPGLGRSYSVSLPHSLGTTADLASLAPVAAVPAPTAFAAANTWTATQTFSASPGIKITSGAASGDVLGSDAAGNATWQSIPAPAGLAPAGLTGATAASRYVGATTSGAPASGTFAVGDFVIDQTGKIWVCTTAGTPGTWTQTGGSSIPLTTLGDMLYENATPALARLAGNTTSTKNFLTQTGTGSASAAPAWGTIAPSDLASTTNEAGYAPLVLNPSGAFAWGAPWQFFVNGYGAKGDGVVCTVNTIASNTTITATSAVFTSTAVDGGKHIMIHGAQGTTSGPLITTISTVTDSTHAVLAAAPTATVNACPAVFGTDDTSAINSAVAAAGTYATANQYFAEVVFSAKIYILASGPTQTGNGTTTPTFNAQIPLPYPAVNGTSQKMILALTGPGDAGYCQYWESLIPNLAGTALVSMTTAPSTPSGTFGNQSVIGGPNAPSGGAAPGFTGGYANLKVIVKGVSVWCPIYTNQYAYDFGWVSAMRVQQSSAQIFAPTGTNGGVQPYLNGITAAAFTNSISTGFRTPVGGNNDDITMDDVTVEGYECAFRLWDHFNASRLAAIYSDVVMKNDSTQNVAGSSSHGIFVQSISAEIYNGGLLSNGGSCQIDINWDAEGTVPTYDINDPANAFYGYFYYGDKVDNRAPVVSGAASLKVISVNLGPGLWSGAPSAPSSGSAQQNTAWRDATIYLSATTGITVIKLGTTTTGLTAASGVTVALRVPSGQSYTVTYTGTLTTTWWLD